MSSQKRCSLPTFTKCDAWLSLTQLAVEEGDSSDLLPFISQPTPQDTPYPSSHIPSPHPYHIPNHSPSPLHPSQSLMSPASQCATRAVGLNDIVSDPNELEHFKVERVGGYTYVSFTCEHIQFCISTILSLIFLQWRDVEVSYAKD